MNTDNFIFTNQNDFIEDDNTFIAYIPQFTSKQEILSLYSSELKFPTYVSNWDALYDWLTDLDWIKEKHIIIIHKNPPARDKRNQIIYLELLHDAVDYWKNIHTLKVIFPIRAKEIIENIIKK